LQGIQAGHITAADSLFFFSINFVFQSTFNLNLSTMETLENIRNSIFNSIGLKLALIAFLSIVLLIPASMITGLIREREQRRDETIQEVTSVWGNAQTLAGPVLTLAFKNTEKTGSNEYRTLTHYAHFLPENLKVTGVIEPQVRSRGIYKVVTYRARLHVSGNFVPPDLSMLQISAPETSNLASWVEIGIPDMRGINEPIRFHWGDSIFPVIPGIPSRQVSNSGAHALLPVGMSFPVNFSFDLDLNGSHNLNFIPLGNESSIQLSSSWKIPSFSGAFLPDARKISSIGFTASWQILQLNRNYPQQWIDDQYTVEDSSFGVDLLTPVDSYQKSMRSVKYAILFIGLTFMIFFFAEVMNKTRIHPVNYLLVGIALCVFYSLLTALAEYLPFGFAYLISGSCIVAMITVFTRSLYRKKTVSLAVSLVLLSLYVFLYVILQLTDYSLLFGNIGLVVILGLVMYFSRKIDWYATVKTATPHEN
jgi:inner membrane protein